MYFIKEGFLNLSRKTALAKPTLLPYCFMLRRNQPTICRKLPHQKLDYWLLLK